MPLCFNYRHLYDFLRPKLTTTRNSFADEFVDKVLRKNYTSKSKNLWHEFQVPAWSGVVLRGWCIYFQQWSADIEGKQQVIWYIPQAAGQLLERWVPAVCIPHKWLAYLFKPLCSANSERKVDRAAEFFISRWRHLLVLNTGKSYFSSIQVHCWCLNWLFCME